MRDKCPEDSDDLPDPDVLAQEIADDLPTALDQFQSIAEGLRELAGRGRGPEGDRRAGQRALPEDQQIHLSAHLLRHTFLRKVARKYGVEYAKELAGHTSERYIWRSVQPSEEEKERAIGGFVLSWFALVNHGECLGKFPPHDSVGLSRRSSLTGPAARRQNLEHANAEVNFASVSSSKSPSRRRSPTPPPTLCRWGDDWQANAGSRERVIGSPPTLCRWKQ